MAGDLLGQVRAACSVQLAKGQQVADSRFPGDSRAHRAANAGTVISVVVIGVIALVGTLIFGQVYDAMPALTVSDPNETHPLNGTPDTIMTGFGNAIEFVPIILLVLLASVVIAVVQRMR